MGNTKRLLVLAFSLNITCTSGSGCGSVGRAVAFDTRGLRFDSSHRQNFIEHLFINSCIEKTKINKKRPGMAHYLISKKQVQTNCLKQKRNLCHCFVKIHRKLKA